VVNTHFDHIGSAARRHAAELVRRFVAERAGHQPVVVLGDFNCGEGSAPYDALLPDRAADAPLLRDAYRVTHPERKPNEGTFNGFLGKADGERIDWILVTQDCLVEECDIISTHEENRYPSDHFFVRANISFGSAR
ncbi:MAG: endonuclease/exonuclease/phosphatase family protein, partial [Planctomycetales bacterium]|nr:endonuclease/exonuclease/phosphatase family protein [Planctomycetales bacterium]